MAVKYIFEINDDPAEMQEIPCCTLRQVMFHARHMIEEGKLFCVRIAGENKTYIVEYIPYLSGVCCYVSKDCPPMLARFMKARCPE